MKTKITHLLRTTRPLLVTFGLKQNPAALARLLIIGLSAFAAAQSDAAASKPGGTGGGTIYYVGPWEGATTGGTAVMTTMNSDGSNKTRLGLGLFGVPSGALHNGHRWFVYAPATSDQYYPNGTRRREVLALRDDYHYADNNNASTRVQLFRASATGGNLAQLTFTAAPLLEQMFEWQGGWR